MSDGLQQLVDFNLVNVKSDTSHPIQNNLIQTIRSHDCNSVENATLLNRIEAVKYAYSKCYCQKVNRIILKTFLYINKCHLKIHL